jgi:hypothetical protein
MKKLFIICSASLFFVACKKDYSCVCKETDTVSALYYEDDNSLAMPEQNFSNTTQTHNFKVKKKESESKCKEYESKNVQKDFYGFNDLGYYGGDRTTETKCNLN